MLTVDIVQDGRITTLEYRWLKRCGTMEAD
jgi:hypothetical protein